MRLAAIIFFAASVVLFCIMEEWQERRQNPALDKSKDDKSLRRIHWCRNFTIFSIILSVIYPLVEIPIASVERFFISAVLVLAGTGIRFRAMTTLGKFFTNAVATQTDQKIIRHGLYKYIRHPSYTGSMVFFLGIGLSTGSVWGFIAVLALMSYGLLKRILVEEKVMMDSFGQEYIDYMNSTKKLIPFVF